MAAWEVPRVVDHVKHSCGFIHSTMHFCVLISRNSRLKWVLELNCWSLNVQQDHLVILYMSSDNHVLYAWLNCNRLCTHTCHLEKNWFNNQKIEASLGWISCNLWHKQYLAPAEIKWEMTVQLWALFTYKVVVTWTVIQDGLNIWASKQTVDINERFARLTKWV